MSSEKPNFRSQPVVKSVFMFRNGDPYYNARRIVINQKRVCNFETLLREVTGGIQAPFGAVRNIYTPRGGHKVDCLESLQSGEQYVAAGRERFKKLDYLEIGSRRKRMLQTLPMQAKPLPQHRIVVSARFLKPIKEPCPIFMVANGDVLNPAMRLLIHQRMLSQFDKILEMITEKMGLRVLGGVRSLYTYEGHQVTDGNQLESGQLYVAVGREKFKKLPYSDLLFTKPRGTRRVNGMKAYSLPPIYRFSKQNGNSKSMVRCSDSGDGDSKSSPPAHSGNKKEHLSSIIREISQTRLITLRKKRSGQSMTFGISDDLESKADDKNTEGKFPQMEQPKEKPAAVDTKASEENGEKAEEKEETSAENTIENNTSASKEEMKENEETNSQVEGEKKKESEETSSQMEGEKKKENEDTSSQIEEEEKKENEETNSQVEGEKKKENEDTNSQIEGEEKKENEETSSQIEGEEKKENEETNSQIKGEEKKENEETNNEKEGQATVEPEEKEKEQSSSSSNNDKTQDRKETEDSSSGGENDKQDKTIEETQDKDSGNKQESSKDPVNDVDTGKEQKEKENSNDPGKTQSDNETKENNNSRSSSRNSNQEENVSKTKEDATKEAVEEKRQVNGDVSGEDDEVESEGEQEVEEENSASHKDATANGKKGENQDKSRKAED
ncbi:doublecortin domain-containing protein 2-like [Scomber japonicus]|uniref:doublecortin domain-containing protein 2-like n=1 Tax=Scomber japonicus TaxID=13676 RepID=UPI00230564E0|nr:doublecortin domain-containing protein 2-like [Scomber japonicus]